MAIIAGKTVVLGKKPAPVVEKTTKPVEHLGSHISASNIVVKNDEFYVEKQAAKAEAVEALEVHDEAKIAETLERFEKVVRPRAKKDKETHENHDEHVAKGIFVQKKSKFLKDMIS